MTSLRESEQTKPLKSRFNHFYTGIYQRWLKKRIPPAEKHTLSRKNIFILPTKFGLAYLSFVLILFLLGTNYQNNLIMLLSYLLVSFFITSMMHSFYNFAQLTIKSTAVQTGFVHQVISFPIEFEAVKAHYNLTLRFTSQSKHDYIARCLPGNTYSNVPALIDERGEHSLGRIKISSEYAFGLFTTWSLLDFDHKGIVYPTPEKLLKNQIRFSSKGNDPLAQHFNQKSDHTSSPEDFSELKNYQLGEPLSRIAWKQVAKGQGKLSKHYQNSQGELIWLNLADMPTDNIELALSYLAYLIEDYHRAGQKYGLSLTVSHDVHLRHGEHSSGDIEPNSGEAHRLACLTALALFPKRRVE